MYKKYFQLLVFSVAIFTLHQEANAEIEVKTILLTHKTPTCGCCKKWVKYANDNGYKVYTRDHKNLEGIKKMYGIKSQYRSCHTSVSKDGFIFEGHIPVKYITQFLSEDHPNAIGLSVPGMPLGSPGMEFDDRFTPYNILILYKDGLSEVYAEILNK